MIDSEQPMAVDEPALFDDAARASSSPRRRRARTVWSADQLLDPMVLVATAPMALFPDRFPREAFLIAAALLVVPYAVRKSNTGRFTAPTPMLWPILALGLVILPASAWVAPSFWAVSWPEFVRFVWGMATLLGVANWCASGTVHLHRDGLQTRIEDHTALATAAWFLLGVAFTAVGMLALRSTSKVPLFGDLAGLLPRADWLPDSVTQGFNTNRVAGLAVLFLPFALALALAPANERGRTTHRGVLTSAAMLLLAVFFTAALLLTQSRSALLAAAIAVVLVSVLAGRRGLIPLVLMAMVAVAALDVFGAGGLVDTFAVGAEQESSSTVWSRIAADRNIAGRILIWRRALHGIADEPFTGMGLAGFEARSQEPYPAMPDWEPDPDVVHAHNLFLQTGLDMGVPGMIALLAIVAIGVWQVTMLFRDTRRATPARFWAIGAAGALAAFILYNLLDAVSVGARPAVSYWMLLGLIAGASAALVAAQEEADRAAALAA